tara:strand:- start:4837 stop:5082 length:246 start_codon:yes stop_codon:yes gene_type:complete
MAFTSDNRPHTLGDLIAITGTVANGDTEIDLSDFMSEILMVQVQPSNKLGTASVAKIAGLVVHFTDISHADGGRLFALGKR